MIPLMAYAIALSGLLGLAALLAERIFAELVLARRSVWLVSLVGSLALPAYSVWTNEISAAGSDGRNAFVLEFVPDVVPLDFASAVTGAISESWLSLPDLQSFDFPLIVFWAVTSALALLVVVFSGIGLYRAVRRAETVQLGDERVVVSDRLGPAVVGFFRPRIVLPRWVAQADSSLRSLVLSHEREHIAAHDQLALLASLLLVASMPWNPALWWQLKRLRAAIEVDCDARVLRAGVDKVAYSSALLSVRQRSYGVPFGAVALTEPVSQLEQRIRIMLKKAGKLSVSRVGIRSALVLALVTFAFAIEAPLAQQSDSDGASAEGRAVVPAIRTAVYDQLSEAEMCMDGGDLGCARAWLESVAQLDLNEYELAQYWNFTAFIEFEEDNSEAAIDAYENVLALENIPQGLREQVLLGSSTLYANSGRHAEAYEKLNELLDLRGIAQVGGPGGPVVSDSEYLPIVKVAPLYPPRAAARGLEGFVVVRFTVTETGLTQDIEVVESSSTLFEQSAIDSAAKWKYKPRIVDGEPVAVPGVMTRINFALEPGAEDGAPEA